MRGWKITGFAALLAGLLPALSAASPTAGQPFGPQFKVNTAPAGNVQRAPSIASNASGGTIVAWQLVPDSPAVSQIRLRRFSALGVGFTDEAPIANGFDPDTAMNAGGGFVVAFNDQDGLRARVFGEDGNATGAAFAVDATGSTQQPSVAMDADGRFALVYFRGTGLQRSIVVRRYGTIGQQVGADIVVTAETTLNQPPVIAMAPDGRFVVAYVVTNNSLSVVKARIYDANGDPVGPAFVASQQDGINVGDVKAAMDGAGRFLLAWSTNPTHIHARGFSAAGTALTDEFEVAADNITGVSLGDVSMSATGESVITYDTRQQGQAQSEPSDVFFRRYDPNFVARGTAVRVNAVPRPRPHQLAPAVALDADGDFTVVWQSGDTGDGAEILGRRFVGPEDVDLSLAITDSPDPVPGSGVLTYTYTVSNNHAAVTPIAGASPGIARINQMIGSSHNVDLTAVLPAGATEVQGTGTQWTCTFSAPQEHCSYQDLLLPGQSSPVTITLHAPATGDSAQTTGTVTEYQLDSHSANDSEVENTTVGVPTGLPVVQFSQATSSVAESAGNRHVVVTLSHQAAQDVTVAFAATGASTASTPGDYTLQSSPVTIPAGETSADIVVTIVNDTTAEPAETVVLQLSSPSANATLGPAATHTLTITDDDGPTVPTVQFHQSAESRDEGAGAIDIALDLSAISSEDVTVTFTVAGTAAAGDYTLTPASHTITIPQGQLHASIVVTPVDDAEDESDETVILTLTQATNATLGANVTNTLTITDDDTAGATPTVQVAEATSEAAESDGTVTVTVQLSSETDHEVSIPFSVGGTATSGTDYTTSTTSPLVIAAGETSGTVTINVVDDGAPESGETIVVTLGTPTGATLGTQSTQIITIVDNDGGGGVGGSHVTLDSAAAGKEVTFTTDRGTFSAISVVDAPANPPAGLEYPLGFFAFVISGVPNNAVTTLTIEVPDDTNISDWIDCVENSCYRYPQDATPDPGQARIDGNVITVKIQDNGPGDNDPRPGFIGSKVAPARVPEDDGGSLTWLLLAPMFGAALVRRRLRVGAA